MATYSLPEITHQDIVLGIIFLKGGGSFDEGALEHGLKKCARNYPLLEDIVRYHSDGTIGESSSLNNTLAFAEMVYLLEPSDCTAPDIRMSEHGRKIVEKQLKDEYGEDIFDRLRPLAEDVWREANENQLLTNNPAIQRAARKLLFWKKVFKQETQN